MHFTDVKKAPHQVILSVTVNLQQKRREEPRLPDAHSHVPMNKANAFNYPQSCQSFTISMPSHQPVCSIWVNKLYCLIWLCQQAMSYSAWHAGPSSSSRCWDHYAGQLHFIWAVLDSLFIGGKLLSWVNPSHTDSMRNWNLQRKRLPELFRWTACTNVKIQKGLCCHLMFERQKYMVVPAAAEEAPAGEDRTNVTLQQKLKPKPHVLAHAMLLSSTAWGLEKVASPAYT